MYELNLKPGAITLGNLQRIAEAPVKLTLDSSCDQGIEESVGLIEDILDAQQIVYGINTGFGKLASERVPRDRLAKLQENIVLSHACGTGALLDDAIVRLIMVLKVNALAQGYSGIRREVIDMLVTLVNAEIYPCIPEKGSVGASGDLAPLSHMSLVLLGHGEVRHQGKVISAAEGLKAAGLSSVALGAKEGLALLNGTQVSLSLALMALFQAEKNLAAGLMAGALSIEAAKGSGKPFSENINAVRRQLGQIDIARKLRDALAGSAIAESHIDCDKVQDPYCLRCMPQVMGACLDHLRFVSDILAREANAVTDNPLVFTETKEIISGGNFHAEPIAMAADTLALVIAELGNMAERRVAMLIDKTISGLPAFLVQDAGVNSGFMLAHVTAAALVSENKQKSFPACVDSIPTSANQEDHVSMATHGARRLLDMNENAAAVIAIELLAAAQGIEFHRPLQTTETLEGVLKIIRDKVAVYDQDRYFAPDIEAIKATVTSGAYRSYAADILPSQNG